MVKSRLPRAELCMRVEGLAVGCKPVIGHVASDKVGKRNGFSIGSGCNIDATTLEFVKESPVVIGSNTGPASTLHLSVENG